MSRVRHATLAAASAVVAACALMALQPAARTRVLAQGTLVVTSTADSGPGSLRDTIASAPADSVITFALPSPSVITLTTAELVIDKRLTIQGPGAKELAISGNDARRIFHITFLGRPVTV